MDRRTLLAALGLTVLAPLAAAAELPQYTRPGRMYDKSGRYIGREDENGRRYDRSGRYQGQTR